MIKSTEDPYLFRNYTKKYVLIPVYKILMLNWGNVMLQIRGPIVISGDQTLDAQLVLRSSEATNFLLQMLVILAVLYRGRGRYFHFLLW